MEIARNFPPRWVAWSTPTEVAPGSNIGEQLDLMAALAQGDISAAAFARDWLAARRRALAEGERVRERFDRILTSVFYALDDYVADPELRDQGDLSDDDLISRVRAALYELSTLE
jgi:hypothetical protein